MKPEDVPAELIELTHRAYCTPGAVTWAEILAAVLPEHEKQVREQVAQEIERVEAEEGDGSSWDGGMGRAASIARGGS